MAPQEKCAAAYCRYRGPELVSDPTGRLWCPAHEQVRVERETVTAVDRLVAAGKLPQSAAVRARAKLAALEAV